MRTLFARWTITGIMLCFGFTLVIGYQNCGKLGGGEGSSSTNPPSATFAYVGDGTNGKVWLCNISPIDATLSECAVSNGGASGWWPSEITIHKIGTNTYAYVASVNQNVWLCSVDTTNGALSGCAINDGGASGWWPMSIKIQTVGANTYAYVAGYTNGNAWVCTVSPRDGTLSGCAVSNGGVSGWWPSSINIQTLGGKTIAYVADTHNYDVWLCNVNTTDGTLSGCAVSNGGASWSQLEGITIQTLGANVYAYVGTGAGDLWLCNVNSTDGTLSGCAVSNGGASGWLPYWIVFQNINAKTVAYVADNGGQMWLCNVNSTDGTLSGCAVTSGGASGWSPQGMGFL